MVDVNVAVRFRPVGNTKIDSTNKALGPVMVNALRAGRCVSFVGVYGDAASCALNESILGRVDLFGTVRLPSLAACRTMRSYNLPHNHRRPFEMTVHVEERTKAFRLCRRHLVHALSRQEVAKEDTALQSVFVEENPLRRQCVPIENDPSVSGVACYDAFLADGKIGRLF